MHFQGVLALYFDSFVNYNQNRRKRFQKKGILEKMMKTHVLFPVIFINPWINKTRHCHKKRHLSMSFPILIQRWCRPWLSHHSHHG